MPLQTHVNQPIELPIVALIAGVILQKARFVEQTYRDEETSGEASAGLRVRIRRYRYDKLATDGFGVFMPDEVLGLKSRYKNLYASNSKIVDAETGEILAMNTGQTAKEWAAVAAGFSQLVSYQGNYYQNKRDYGTTPNGDDIRAHIAMADQMGLFDPATGDD